MSVVQLPDERIASRSLDKTIKIWVNSNAKTAHIGF